MEGIRRAADGRGWPSTTGPFEWFEADFRVDSKVEGLTISLIAVVPYRRGETGWISMEELSDGLAPEHIARQLLHVVSEVLVNELHAVDVQQHERPPAPIEQ